ncbi:CAP domain-containing protein [Rubellimicrobium aerolatum]|uniref:CAP domain-containing protein n=1 Tax=Rubellimicrobium aerolatum TaxID=490979 RepID=A0ABW0SCD2_9RHOB|nr:CAP domain-containing protein [Rubellimicrobium aerolatum]MBP1806245.1 uncharacterized protein YkwD [Rubellimicrobium aerolatum]
MRLVPWLLAPWLLSGCLMADPTPRNPAPAGGSVSSSSETIPASASSVAGFGAALNRMRAQAGLEGLREDGHLKRAAQAFAEDMAANGYHSHHGRDGSTVVERARRAGCGGRGYVAENIAWGQDSVQDTFAGWSASAGHRANMLGRNYGVYGLGQAGGMWVLVVADGC